MAGEAIYSTITFFQEEADGALDDLALEADNALEDLAPETDAAITKKRFLSISLTAKDIQYEVSILDILIDQNSDIWQVFLNNQFTLKGVQSKASDFNHIYIPYAEVCQLVPSLVRKVYSLGYYFAFSKTITICWNIQLLGRSPPSRGLATIGMLRI